MGTCVIATDTLNEGYQSVEVWHGGRAGARERRKRPKEKHRGDKSKKESKRRHI